jgi:hypothetical protein
VSHGRQEHVYLADATHRAELARLFLAEAERGEVLRCADSDLGLPLMDAVDREHHLACARALDETRYLVQHAADPQEVGRLLALRGMPELAIYLVAIVWSGFRSRAGGPGAWCRTQAKRMRRADGALPGAKAFREREPETVARALEWAASKFDSFAPLPPHEDRPSDAGKAQQNRSVRTRWKDGSART